MVIVPILKYRLIVVNDMTNKEYIQQKIIEEATKQATEKFLKESNHNNTYLKDMFFKYLGKQHPWCTEKVEIDPNYYQNNCHNTTHIGEQCYDCFCAWLYKERGEL